MLEDSDNILLPKKPVEEVEEDILVFEDEEENVIKREEKPKEIKHPEIPVEEDKRIEPPEDEIAMAYDFTIPKQKLLDKEKFPAHRYMIEPISQDIATAHLGAQASTIVHDNMRLVLMILALGNMTGKTMIEAQRFHVGKVSTYANISKGELGNLLKLLRSNYTITEEKREEKLQTDTKLFEESKQKGNGMFGFGGGGN